MLPTEGASERKLRGDWWMAGPGRRLRSQTVKTGFERITMRKWIVDFEVEAHVVLHKEQPCLEYKSPDGGYLVQLRNYKVDPGIEAPVLSVQVIFESESAQAAVEEAKDKLRLCLDTLACITGSRWKIHRVIRAIDWTPGITERDCRQVKDFSNPDLPVFGVGNEHVDTLRLLMTKPMDPDLRLALRWFARGVNVDYADERFQFFWFALEILAERGKAPEMVPDRCPKCRTELFCPRCQKVSVHKPYPKQAIQQLLEKHVRGHWLKLFTILDKVRNSLLHGEYPDEIEKSLSIDLVSVADHLGKAVWAALISSFSLPAGEKKLSFIQPQTFSHMKLSMWSDLSIGSDRADPNHPKIEAFTEVQVDMRVGEGQWPDQKPGDTIVTIPRTGSPDPKTP